MELVQGLPRDSALARALDPDRDVRESWQTTQELLAQAIEEISRLSRLFHVVHFQEPHPEARRVPRPTDPEEPEPTRRPATGEDMKQLFAGGTIHFVPSAKEPDASPSG